MFGFGCVVGEKFCVGIRVNLVICWCAVELKACVCFGSVWSVRSMTDGVSWRILFIGLVFR